MAVKTSWAAGDVLTAADLTDTFAAKLTTPGAWTSWTPTWTNLTVGNGTVTAFYGVVGKICFVRLLLLWGSTTSASGAWRPNLPVTPATGNDAALGPIFMYDNSTGAIQSGIFVHNFNLIYGSSGVTATTPWTWAVNDQLRLSVTYETV